MMVHCLFEQSGTFKKAFKEHGIDAEDYDILNDFGETDHVVDLFEQIDRGGQGAESIFDDIEQDDLIFAFFPCTRFMEVNALILSGQSYNQRHCTLNEKLYQMKKAHKELARMYELITTMVQIADAKGLQMIIENPATPPHYLSSYWLPATIVDKDRTVRGDKFKKPTQYWFINREPHHNLVMKPQEQVDIETINGVKGPDRQVQRSMISNDYANNFIEEFIL